MENGKSYIKPVLDTTAALASELPIGIVWKKPPAKFASP